MGYPWFEALITKEFMPVTKTVGEFMYICVCLFVFMSVSVSVLK